MCICDKNPSGRKEQKKKKITNTARFGPKYHRILHQNSPSISSAHLKFTRCIYEPCDNFAPSARKDRENVGGMGHIVQGRFGADSNLGLCHTSFFIIDVLFLRLFSFCNEIKPTLIWLSYPVLESWLGVFEIAPTHTVDGNGDSSHCPISIAFRGLVTCSPVYIFILIKTRSCRPCLSAATFRQLAWYMQALLSACSQFEGVEFRITIKKDMFSQ